MAAAAMNGSWGYQTPLEESESNARSYMGQYDTYEKPARSGPRRTSSAYDLQSDGETAHVRKASMRASNVTSAGRKRSRNTLRDKTESLDRGSDDSKWIHRDKLAEIEIREMEEAGFHVRQSRRSMSTGAEGRRRSSRSASRSDRYRKASPDQYGEDEYPASAAAAAAAYSGQDDFERRRISTIPSQHGDEAAVDADADFRAHDEFLNDQQEQAYRTVRPSTSRIPISVGGVAGQSTDRDSVPGSRAGGGIPAQNWEDLHHSRRVRSGSISSQVVLDEPHGQQLTPPGSMHKTSANGDGSPPKSRVPKKGTPAGRKASAADSQKADVAAQQNNKSRTPSSTAANKRLEPEPEKKRRPSSSHDRAPEGDPPWISSMYKPDPRLPPDQQMLPTHAKRLAQEQWERDGKSGSAYDKDFRLLNDRDPSDKSKASAARNSFGLDSSLIPDFNSKGLPEIHLPTTLELPQTTTDGSAAGSAAHSPGSETFRMDRARSETAGSRPGTSGGYRITPTIAPPPPVEKSPSPRLRDASPTTHNMTPRVPELDEKDEAEMKKGCCCVVM